jgi:hypothetical protein
MYAFLTHWYPCLYYAWGAIEESRHLPGGDGLVAIHPRSSPSGARLRWAESTSHSDDSGTTKVA